jgi:hypothetical protein
MIFGETNKAVFEAYKEALVRDLDAIRKSTTEIHRLLADLDYAKEGPATLVRVMSEFNRLTTRSHCVASTIQSVALVLTTNQALD